MPATGVCVCVCVCVCVGGGGGGGRAVTIYLELGGSVPPPTPPATPVLS